MNITLTIAAALVATPALALAQGMQGMQHEKGAASQAYLAAHEKMMNSMSATQPSGDPDKDFVVMMIPHHQGAIDMAKVELQYGKDPELKKMAQKIIDAQEKEIAEFKKWQSGKGK